MLQMKTKIIEITPTEDYQFIVRLIRICLRVMCFWGLIYTTMILVHYGHLGDSINCLQAFDWEIDSTWSGVLDGLIDTFIHDNLRSMWNAAIIDMRQVWQWIRIMMIDGYPDVDIRG